jgi:molybdopterin-synthase adenylyltransferase
MSVHKVYGKDAEKLLERHVVIIGIGGLGCTVANLLARMKVRLTLIDNDIVDDTNLERQTLFEIKDLLHPKVEVAKERLEQFAEIKIANIELREDNINRILPKDIDLLIDCTDNVKTRQLINKYCYEHNISWIYSGAVSNIGIIYFINRDKACYECINKDKKGETSCEVGVLNTVVTIVASITVHVAIDYLIKNKIEQDIIRISDNNIVRLKTRKDPKCIVCKN